MLVAQAPVCDLQRVLLALTGGAVGTIGGVLATAIYANPQSWAVVIPPVAWNGGIGAAVTLGAIAGLLTAIQAARQSPTDALRTT